MECSTDHIAQLPAFIRSVFSTGAFFIKGVVDISIEHDDSTRRCHPYPKDGTAYIQLLPGGLSADADIAFSIYEELRLEKRSDLWDDNSLSSQRPANLLFHWSADAPGEFGVRWCINRSRSEKTGQFLIQCLIPCNIIVTFHWHHAKYG
jgi:hypothetical protein